MPDIPLLNLVNPAPVGGVNVNSAVMTAPARALQEAGASIGKAGEAARNIAVKLMDTRDSGLLSEYRIMIAEQEAGMREFVAANPDPEKWEPEIEKRQARLNSDISKLKLSPARQSELLQRHREWEATSRLKLGEEAAFATIRESRQRGLNELEQLEAAGDLEGVRHRVAEMVDLQLLPKSSADALVWKAERGIATREMADLLELDPRGALEIAESDNFAANMPGASESDRQRLAHRAKIGIQHRQSQEVRQIAEAIGSGKIATETDLDDALKRATYIDEAVHDEVRFNFQQRQPVDADTRFAITDQLNELHDAYKGGEMSMDDYRAAHDEIAQVVYAMGARDGTGALRQRVHALDPAAWNGTNLQEAREQSREREVTKLSSVYQRAGAFGAIDDDEEIEPFDRAEREAEILRRRERVEQRMTDWLRDPANEDKDFDAQFRRTALDEVAASVLSASTPSIDQRRRSLDEMLGTSTSRAGRASGPPGVRDDTPDRPVGGNLKAIVKQFEAGGEKEGFHRQAYWDYGQWSIGYGTKSKQCEVIDQAEAERRLDSELSMHRKRVEAEAKRIGMTFEPHELDALTSFDYNTGSIGKLLAGGTRSKTEIASKMLLYRNAKGQRLRGLERRRMAEAKLFRRGYTD